jgi:hypothetical protein
MARPCILPLVVTLLAVACFAFAPPGFSENTPPPQTPASISWLPHGYGGKMWVNATMWNWQKGLLGFRNAPSHIGCWSHPLWGWDVNGYFRGPNVPSPDPVMCQLPIGLIYPENTPPGPPPPQRRIRK